MEHSIEDTSLLIKKIVEVDIPDGLHVGQASDSDGKEGMLFDDDGNLRDHAVFKKVGNDEETVEAIAAITNSAMPKAKQSSISYLLITVTSKTSNLIAVT